MRRILDEENNSNVGRLLTRLRSVDAQRDRAHFRAALHDLGYLLALEIAKTMPNAAPLVRTPLGERTEPMLAQSPVLATVLRAGLPMFEGALAAFPDSDCMFFGAARREGKAAGAEPRMHIECGYAAFSAVEGRTLIYVDPMLATGSTLLRVHEEVLLHAGRPARVIVAAVVAYRPSIALLERELGAEVYCASADDELDARGYIVPGLGDAGDLAYGARLA